MSQKEDDWLAAQEAEGRQYHLRESGTSLLRILDFGRANRRIPEDMGRAIFELALISDYMNRGSGKPVEPDKKLPGTWDWCLGACDHAVDMQMSLSTPTNSRDEYLQALIFEKWKESNKSQPNIDIGMIPDVVGKK